jgi:hypothetical protein
MGEDQDLDKVRDGFVPRNKEEQRLEKSGSESVNDIPV